MEKNCCFIDVVIYCMGIGDSHNLVGCLSGTGTCAMSER